jgi:hypothetical protein
MTYSTIRFEKTPGQTGQDLVMQGGTMGSAGAGVQREREERYRWDGRRFALFGTTYEKSDYLYFKIIDANAAMANQDYAGAIEIYKQALSDDTLKTWKKGQEQAERTGLRAFAAFRLYTCYLLKGDTAAANAAANDLKQTYASTGYAALAELFGKAYQSSKQLTTACGPVSDYVRKHPELLEPLNGFGYANTEFTAEDICPAGKRLDATP